MADIYKNDPTTGTIYFLHNQFQGAEGLIPLFVSTADGTGFSYYDPGIHFKYRGLVIDAAPAADDIGVNYLWPQIVTKTQSSEYTLAVFNRLTNGQSISLGVTDSEDIYSGRNLAIVNVGPPAIMQLRTIRSAKPEVTPYTMETGDIMVFANAPVTLANYSYSVIITDNIPRSFLTIVSSKTTHDPVTGIATAVNLSPPAGTPGSKSAKKTSQVLPDIRLITLPPADTVEVQPTSKYTAPPRLDLPAIEQVQGPLNKIEYARILGLRANHLAENLPPFVDPGNETNAIRIADMELKAARTNAEVREKLRFINIERFNPKFGMPGEPEFVEVSIADLINL